MQAARHESRHRLAPPSSRMEAGGPTPVLAAKEHGQVGGREATEGQMNSGQQQQQQGDGTAACQGTSGGSIPACPLRIDRAKQLHPLDGFARSKGYTRRLCHFGVHTA
jgi:hypothetical protein